MHRSLSRLRQGLLGIAFVSALGFGATQALASPDAAAGARAYCPIDPDGPYYSNQCGAGCNGGVGYCTTRGICKCGYIP